MSQKEEVKKEEPKKEDIKKETKETEKKEKKPSEWNDQDFYKNYGEEMFQEPSDLIQHRVDLLNDEVQFYMNEQARMNNEIYSMQEKMASNKNRIKTHCQLPYLVAHVVEILELGENDDEEEDGSGLQVQTLGKGNKSAVVKTTTRQTVFLPVPGIIDANKLRPGDLVGVNKDSFLILELLPVEFDSRVKAMEIDERPKEDYNQDVGGLEKQIKELVEAVVWPMKYPERFKKVGIQPPKGVLLYGEPGTGKTLLARACAANTDACFLKLAGPQLVQMYIGDGAKLIRDAFALAKLKQPAIIFIDELDAIGTRRFSSEKSGDREVQRTMLELLNQMDGFEQNDQIKVIAATNRVDILDPALLRSGRFDRKVEFPLPDELSRKQILQIHSKKMNVDPDVNYQELARCTEDFNGAQLKAVCVEAGMFALRRDATIIHHEDFMEGISQVKAKKKTTLNYYT